MSDLAVDLPENVLAEARAAARQDGLSLDRMIAALVTEALDHRKGLTALRERASRADVARAMTILDRIPDVPPENGDELR